MAKYSPLERAVAIVGSQAELARQISVSPQRVSQWMLGKVPISPDRVIPIEQATDGVVTRHELRPDIYPVEAA